MCGGHRHGRPSQYSFGAGCLWKAVHASQCWRPHALLLQNPFCSEQPADGHGTCHMLCARSCPSPALGARWAWGWCVATPPCHPVLSRWLSWPVCSRLRLGAVSPREQSMANWLGSPPDPARLYRLAPSLSLVHVEKQGPNHVGARIWGSEPLLSHPFRTPVLSACPLLAALWVLALPSAASWAVLCRSAGSPRTRCPDSGLRLHPISACWT